MRFKTDWVSLIIGSKFTVFALCYFVFEGNFPSTSPRGGLYWEGRFKGGFFALPVRGAYIWRGLFSEFYGMLWFCCGSGQFCRLTALGCKIIAKNLNSNALINALRD